MQTTASFEHFASSVAEIQSLLKGFGIDQMLLKVLPKNANDKNQVYLLRSLVGLHAVFDMSFSERAASTSLTKSGSKPGDNIPEACFNDFRWVDTSGKAVRAKNVKAIVYTQYPEVRLSGFATEQNTMPSSLSLAHTKAYPDAKRLLVLGHTPGGGCLAFMFVGFDEALEREIADLPGFDGSRVCKTLLIPQGYSHKLFDQLRTYVLGPAHSGFRLNVKGERIPFDGTQVCGYTLEGLLGIVPNSSKDGDLYGIELKAHTMPKITLFTTEPDFGLYVDNFEKMITTYGYLSAKGEWRLTGIHRAGVTCKKSGLTLHVREYRPATPDDATSDWIRDERGERISFPYDPSTSLTSKMNAVEVVLVDAAGVVAAGWSLERLMNNWGAKHNEVVYVSAEKSLNRNVQDLDKGFTYQVLFSPEIIWCRKTSAELLLKALSLGDIYLDPAHKFVAHDRSKNKRRCQWRINDIRSSVHHLYRDAFKVNLATGLTQGAASELDFALES